MRNERDLVSLIEGNDESGKPKAACCVMIQGYERENEPEEVTSFCTTEAVVSIMTTDLWSVVDLTFEDDLDYDLIQMWQVCKEYSKLVQEEEKRVSLVLSVTPLGNYDFFMVGMGGGWSLLADEPGMGCNGIRFMFLKDRFGVYELSDKEMKIMIEEAALEME